VAVTKCFVFSVFVEAEGKISGEKSPAIDGRRGLFFRDKDGEHPEVYLFTIHIEEFQHVFPWK
jgi:hypothetical protein